MISVAICEDESYFLDSISELLNQYLRDKKTEASVMKFSSGEEFMISGQDSDIILMDIRLPGQDGMNIMEQLRNNKKNGQVIFISAYQDYVFQAFDVNAINYLLKPIVPIKFFAAIDKAMERIRQNCDNVLLISNGSSFSKIQTKNIYYCEVFNHQVFIHTTTETYRYSGILDSLEEELDDDFFRCHRSYIINMRYVVSKAPDAAYMAGGDKVLISRRKQKEFRQRLLEICRRESM